MNKAELLQYLTDKHIDFIKYEHAPIFSVEEGDASGLPNHDKVIRNLFLCDAKVVINLHYLRFDRHSFFTYLSNRGTSRKRQEGK